MIENKYVTFKLGEEYYGISIDNVISIEKMEDATRIPNGPKYLLGVINLRGEVIPLIDLRLKLQMEKKERDTSTRVIIVNSDEISLGLVVDSSSEVIDIAKGNIDNPPSSPDNKLLDYIDGIGKVDERVIILLDLTKILEI